LKAEQLYVKEVAGGNVYDMQPYRVWNPRLNSVLFYCKY